MRNDVERLLPRDRQFGVLGAEVPGDGGGMVGFVEIGIVETDGEGLDLAHVRRVHQRHDGGGIHPAGQERPERHVGDHAALHGILQQTFEAVGQFGIAASEWVCQSRPRHGPRVPERGGVRLALPWHGQDSAGRKLEHVLVDRMRSRDVTVPQIRSHRRLVDPRLEVRVLVQPLELGGEHELLAEPGPVKRLDAETVAHQREGAVLTVPNGDGEHADQTRHRLRDAEFGDRFDDDFRIGVSAEVASAFLQVGANFLEVVDLAVEDDDVAAVMGEHRLMPFLRQVHDRQAPMG